MLIKSDFRAIPNFATEKEQKRNFLDFNDVTLVVVDMSYIFGKLWHSAIIWSIRKAFQCIPQGVRFLLAKQTLGGVKILL